MRDGELVEFKKGADAIGYSSDGEKNFETIHFSLVEGNQVEFKQNEPDKISSSFLSIISNKFVYPFEFSLIRSLITFYISILNFSLQILQKASIQHK